MGIGYFLSFFLVFIFWSTASGENQPIASIKGFNYYKYTNPTDDGKPLLTTGFQLLNTQKRIVPEKLLQPPASADLITNEDHTKGKNIENPPALIRKSRHYYGSDAYRYGYYDRYGRFHYNDWSYPSYRSNYNSEIYYPATKQRSYYNDYYKYPSSGQYYYGSGGYSGDFSYGKRNWNDWRGSSYYNNDDDYYSKRRTNDDYYYDSYYDNYNKRCDSLGNYNNYNNNYGRYRYWRIDC